jgi:O-acetylhomoserine/O-acetylserine sulfhydrylase-like pyridoxal-dependent enzyme
MSNDVHHVELHKAIMQTDGFAHWLFSDLFFDCDNQAVERTGYRINSIDDEHGPKALFGVAANWALMIVSHLRKYYYGRTQEMPGILTLLEEDFDTSKLDEGQRGYLSATQFIQAISFDDLEMAEALFMAARESSLDDTGAFMTAVASLTLHTYHTFV